MSIQQIVDELVLAADGAPDEAEQILLGAAEDFRREAAGADHSLAVELAHRAEQLEAMARDRATFGVRATVDDFEELEREQAQAHAEVGHLGDLEIRARRDQIHEERHSGRDHVSITPESVTQKTPLGRLVTIKFDPTEDDRAGYIVGSDQIVEWQGQKNESQTWTIDVNVREFPPTTSGLGCRPYGVLQYGADGFISEPNTIEFDIGMGQRITGVGNYVSVRVGMSDPGTATVAAWNPASVYSVGDRVKNGGRPYVCVQAGTSALSGGPTGNAYRITDGTVVWAYASGVMTIGGGLGFFAASTRAPITRTWFVDDLGGGSTTAVFVRPRRAVAILPPQSTDTTSTVTLSFLDFAGEDVGSLTYTPGTIVAPIPLMGDYAAFRLTNNGVGTSTHRLPFLLSL